MSSIMNPACRPSNVPDRTGFEAGQRIFLQRWLAAGVLLGVLLPTAAWADEIDPCGAGPETFLQRRAWDPVIRSYAGFRLTLRAGVSETYRRPGEHQLTVGDSAIRLRIRRISREELLRSGSRVLSEVTFAGWNSKRRMAFRTGEGLVYRLSDGQRRARWLLRSLSAGQKVLMKRGGGAPGCLRVKRLLYPPSEGWPRRKQGWKVELRMEGGEEVCFWKPGRYRFSGVAEGVSAHLQEVRKCRLSVDSHPLDAYVADDPRARQKGLQEWEELNVDEAMLFVFQRSLRPSFVMKEVSFPLSIAFVRRDGTLVHVGSRSPGDQRAVRPPEPVTYVLEVNRGWFRERGLGTGASVNFGGPAAPQAKEGKR